MTLDTLPRIEHSVFIGAAPDRVWQAWTTAEGLDAWWTKGSRVDHRIGGILHFRWVNFGAADVSADDAAVITLINPMKQFGFRWNPGPFQTDVLLTVTSKGSGTLLRAEEGGFPGSLEGLQTLIQNAAGWGEAMTLSKFYLEHGITYGAISKPEDNPMKRISKVTKVSWSVAGANSIKLHVEGETTTTGWSDFTLIPVEGRPRTYDVVGREPGASGDAITPVLFDFLGLPGGHYTVTVRGDSGEASTQVDYDGGHPI